MSKAYTKSVPGHRCHFFSGSHPSALVYLPSSFDPTPPLDVVVYLHGWNNCVENVIRDTGASCDADAGTPARSARNALERARLRQ